MENQEITDESALKERRRCVGIVLSEFGIQKAGGRDDVAAILDRLATAIEYPTRGEWLPHPND